MNNLDKYDHNAFCKEEDGNTEREKQFTHEQLLKKLEFYRFRYHRLLKELQLAFPESTKLGYTYGNNGYDLIFTIINNYAKLYDDLQQFRHGDLYIPMSNEPDTIQKL